MTLRPTGGGSETSRDVTCGSRVPWAAVESSLTHAQGAPIVEGYPLHRRSSGRTNLAVNPPRKRVSSTKSELDTLEVPIKRDKPLADHGA